ncbi:MAG: methylmalonyl Co-A mutase-associated GTPase MeaB [Bacteroidota bacterium]|nr:methylmalonyl Co-A mutase-associated GTPase MeaB [Bacteroidota bacterium]
MNKSINPNLNKFLKKNKAYKAKEFADKIISGDRNFLSRAITILESTKPSDIKLASEIIHQCLPYSGKSRRIGITGVPGVGKSTFIDIFGKHLIDKGCKIAILAIDPSSTISGGSILGDKTRMESLSGEKNAFIRPSPTSGNLGGVASKTRESIVLCEAAGFDTIIIETVGVGQSEISVSSMVDVFIMLLVSGTGDDLQGIKRGIMEMLDILVFTKDDGANKNPTLIAKKQFEIAIKMFPTKKSLWIPEVLSVSAIENNGINDVLTILNKYFAFIKENDFFNNNRKNQSKQWFHDQISCLLKTKFYSSENIKTELQTIENKIVEKKLSPISAAYKLIEKYFEKT